MAYSEGVERFAAGPNIHVIRSWAAGQSGDSAYSGEPTVASSLIVKNTDEPD